MLLSHTAVKARCGPCAPRLVRNAVPLVAGTPPTLRSRPSGRRKGPPCSPRHRTASPGYRRDELKTTCRVRYQRKLTVRPGTMRDHITSQPEFRRSSRSEVPSEELHPYDFAGGAGHDGAEVFGGGEGLTDLGGDVLRPPPGRRAGRALCAACGRGGRRGAGRCPRSVPLGQPGRTRTERSSSPVNGAVSGESAAFSSRRLP